MKVSVLIGKCTGHCVCTRGSGCSRGGGPTQLVMVVRYLVSTVRPTSTAGSTRGGGQRFVLGSGQS